MVFHFLYLQKKILQINFELQKCHGIQEYTCKYLLKGEIKSCQTQILNDKKLNIIYTIDIV